MAVRQEVRDLGLKRVPDQPHLPLEATRNQVLADSGLDPELAV
jgi:hypothetical protein